MSWYMLNIQDILYILLWYYYPYLKYRKVIWYFSFLLIWVVNVETTSYLWQFYAFFSLNAQDFTACLYGIQWENLQVSKQFLRHCTTLWDWTKTMKCFISFEFIKWESNINSMNLVIPLHSSLMCIDSGVVVPQHRLESFSMK